MSLSCEIFISNDLQAGSASIVVMGYFHRIFVESRRWGKIYPLMVWLGGMDWRRELGRKGKINALVACRASFRTEEVFIGDNCW